MFVLRHYFISVLRKFVKGYIGQVILHIMQTQFELVINTLGIMQMRL